ncbi:MAG: SIS domain-containing protein [Acidobacteriia bacterium]|nr:SIS domain-containing protein [Terriglobia bacterium]
MSTDLRAYLVESSAVLTAAADSISQAAMDGAVQAAVTALAAGKPLLVCGNGGSASDAMHITGELVGRFLRDRRALRAICLSDNPAVLTAWSNDQSYETVFARQVEAYGEPGAVLLGLSTSGSSKNMLAAFREARRMGLKTIAFTGASDCPLASLADFALSVPSRSTPLIQQVHVCLYHYLCGRIEALLTEPPRG